MGKISDTKIRYALTLKKETKEKLTEIATEQNRSLNNLIQTVLDEYLRNLTK